jgi:uncharacterized protein (DUF58 family)
MHEPPKPQLQLNTRLLPVLVTIIIVMHLAYPFKGWLILLIGLGGAWLIGFLWAQSLAWGLHLTREMRFGWAQVGDRLEERFTLANTGPAPALWVEIIDHSTLPDYQPGRVTGVGTSSENRWQTQGVCTRRGIFTLGPTTLRSGDPLGIYTISLHQPDSVTLTITPPIVPLPTIDVAPGGRAGEGRSQPNAFERTVSAVTVRDYVPGDSLRHIHWPTTARRNKLSLRLFDSTPAGDWWIILDLDRRVQAGHEQDSTEEHGVILAASLADRGLQAGRAVGLVTYGEALAWLPPQTGEAQRLEILRQLAIVEPGDAPLAQLLARGHSSFEQVASLIIITAAVSGDWIEALLPLLRRGAIATVLLLDPVSFGGAGDISPSQALLSKMGVSHHLITRDLLDRPEAQPGQRGHWAWQISSSGRAVAVRRPDDIAWRALKR